jgi:predicted aspartyl protease
MRVRIYGPDGTSELEALVDTSATFTKVSRSLVSRIGVRLKREVLTQVATGEIIKRQTSALDAEIKGVRDTVPVVIGEDHEPTVIGYTTLEILGFKINPVTGELEPTHALDY